jgi:hypothetical protein
MLGTFDLACGYSQQSAFHLACGCSQQSAFHPLLRLSPFGNETPQLDFGALSLPATSWPSALSAKVEKLIT